MSDSFKKEITSPLQGTNVPQSPANQSKQDPDVNHENQTTPQTRKQEILSQADFEAALARLVTPSKTDYQAQSTSSHSCDCPKRPNPKPRCGCDCKCSKNRPEQVNLATGEVEVNTSFAGQLLQPRGCTCGCNTVSEPRLTRRKVNGYDCTAVTEMAPCVKGEHVYHYSIPEEHYESCYDCDTELTCIATAAPDPSEDRDETSPPLPPSPGPNDFDLKEPDGTTHRFHDNGQVSYRIDPNGDRTVWHRDMPNRPDLTTRIRRTYQRQIDQQQSAAWFEEVRFIEYRESALGNLRPTAVKLRRRQINGGGEEPWQDISEISLAYDSQQLHANVAKVSVRYMGDDNQWGAPQSTLYRYHNGSGGGANQLKMVIQPESYARIENPELLDDEALVPYAESVFLYDAKGRVRSVSTRGAP